MVVKNEFLRAKDVLATSNKRTVLWKNLILSTGRRETVQKKVTDYFEQALFYVK